MPQRRSRWIAGLALAAFSTTTVAWAAPDWLRAKQHQAEDHLPADGLEAILRPTSAAGAEEIDLFDTGDRPFKLLVAAWLEYQRTQGAPQAAEIPGTLKTLFGFHGKLSAPDSLSLVRSILRVLGQSAGSATVDDLKRYLEAQVRAAIRHPDGLSALQKAVASAASASVASSGAQSPYIKLVPAVQQALAHLAGLEEPKRFAPKDIRFVVWRSSSRDDHAQTMNHAVIEAVTSGRRPHRGALVFPVSDIGGFSQRVLEAGDRRLVIAVLPWYAIKHEKSVDQQIAVARGRGRRVDVIAVAPPATSKMWSATLFQAVPQNDSTSVFPAPTADNPTLFIETAVRDRLAARLALTAPFGAAVAEVGQTGGLEEEGSLKADELVKQVQGNTPRRVTVPGIVSGAAFGAAWAQLREDERSRLTEWLEAVTIGEKGQKTFSLSLGDAAALLADVNFNLRVVSKLTAGSRRKSESKILADLLWQVALVEPERYGIRGTSREARIATIRQLAARVGMKAPRIPSVAAPLPGAGYEQVRAILQQMTDASHVSGKQTIKLPERLPDTEPLHFAVAATRVEAPFPGEARWRWSGEAPPRLLLRIADSDLYAAFDEEGHAALVTSAAGLEEPLVVIQPGTPVFDEIVNGSMGQPLDVIQRLTTWLVDQRRRRHRPPKALIRVVPDDWHQAHEWESAGFQPLTDSATVLTALRQAAWTPQGVTRDAEGREHLILQMASPLQLHADWPPLATLAVTPTAITSFQGDQQFPRRSFREVLRRLASEPEIGAHLTPPERRELEEGLETYVGLGRLVFLRIPYGIPDPAVKNHLAEDWHFPGELVASEMEMRRAEAELTRAREAEARAQREAASQRDDAGFDRLATAVRREATEAYTALTHSLTQRRATLLEPDGHQLAGIQRRLAALDPARDGALVRWLRQRFRQGPLATEVARQTLRKEREALHFAIAKLAEGASPLTQHVTRMEQAVSNLKVPAARATLRQAPEALATLAGTVWTRPVEREAPALRRLDAMVLRVHHAMQDTNLHTDTALEGALRRWEALAVALLTVTGQVTDVTAQAFFDDPQSLEGDLWSWIRFAHEALPSFSASDSGVMSWAGEATVLVAVSPPASFSEAARARYGPARAVDALTAVQGGVAAIMKDRPAPPREAIRAALDAAVATLAETPPPPWLKAGLLLGGPAAVRNLEAVSHHLQATVASRLGFWKTVGHFVRDADRAYEQARRALARGSSHDALWAPVLPSFAALLGMTPPSEAHLADLVGRLEQGARVEGLALAELLAVIARLGADVRYAVVSTQPVSRGPQRSWVWLNGRWMPVPSATTDLEGFVRRRLRALGRAIAVQAGPLGYEFHPAEFVQIRETDRGVLLEYPPFEPLVLTQMAELQQRMNPPGVVWCDLQQVASSDGVRHVRVEISANPLPPADAAGPSTMLGTGLEEPEQPPAPPTSQQHIELMVAESRWLTWGFERVTLRGGGKTEALTSALQLPRSGRLFLIREAPSGASAGPFVAAIQWPMTPGVPRVTYLDSEPSTRAAWQRFVTGWQEQMSGFPLPDPHDLPEEVVRVQIDAPGTLLEVGSKVAVTIHRPPAATPPTPPRHTSRPPHGRFLGTMPVSAALAMIPHLPITKVQTPTALFKLDYTSTDGLRKAVVPMADSEKGVAVTLDASEETLILSAPAAGPSTMLGTGLGENRAAAERRALEAASATQRLTQRLQPLEDQSLVLVIGPSVIAAHPELRALEGLQARLIVMTDSHDHPDTLRRLRRALQPAAGAVAVDYIGDAEEILDFCNAVRELLAGQWLVLRRAVVTGAGKFPALWRVKLTALAQKMVELTPNDSASVVQQLLLGIAPDRQDLDTVVRDTLRDLETRWQA